MKYSSSRFNQFSIIKALTMVALTAGFLMSYVAASAQEYTKVTRLGTSQAVCSAGVESAADLQEYFANNPDAIRAILADSGWAGSADDVLAAVNRGEFTEQVYPVGTKLAWMGAKVKGQYVANPYREWAGKKSFEAFQLNLSSGCQVYELAIPKACCNISLVAVSPDTSSECSLGSSDDALGAANSLADGSDRLAGANDSAGSDAGAKALALIPFFGVFGGTETRPRLETAWNMDMRDSSGIIGVRAGLKKAISDKTSIFTQLSYYDRQGINGGNVYPEDNLAIDIGLERQLSKRAFIGGGIGAWNVDDSDFRDTSIFGHVGGDIGKTNLQWFLEGRVFDSDSETLDSISSNRMFSAGVRYLVK